MAIKKGGREGRQVKKESVTSVTIRVIIIIHFNRFGCCKRKEKERK